MIKIRKRGRWVNVTNNRNNTHYFGNNEARGCAIKSDINIWFYSNQANKTTLRTGKDFMDEVKWIRRIAGTTKVVVQQVRQTICSDASSSHHHYHHNLGRSSSTMDKMRKAIAKRSGRHNNVTGKKKKEHVSPPSSSQSGWILITLWTN